MVEARRRQFEKWRPVSTGASFLVAALSAAGLVVALPAEPAAALSGPTWPVLVANDAGSVSDIGPTWSTTIPVGSEPETVGVTPDDRYAYVANYGSNSVSVIANPATAGARVVDTLAVGSGPYGLAFTPDGRYCYVADYGAHTVSVIDNADSSDPSVSATVLDVASGPDAIAVTPDGDYAYVTDYGTNKVNVIDGADSASPSVSAAALTVGNGPTDIALTPDGDYAYVADYRSDAVSVIDNTDSSSPSVSASTLAVAGQPEALAVSPDGNDVYSANETTNNVSVVTGASSGSPSVASGALSAGSSPWAIAVVPDDAPIARLTVTAGQPGTPTSLSAASSSVELGSIASYYWSFGDGTNATTTTPSTTHTYASAGTYTATVTETDAAGTSTSQVTDGKAVEDDGGPSATASASVVVGASLCSPSSASTSCPVSATISVSGGTLSLLAPSELYFDDLLTGYDQWGTASESPLSGCTSTGERTTCSAGQAPSLEVIDATGSAAGWAVSEYLSSSDLPSGSVIDFDGAGSTPGDTVAAGLGAFPFTEAAPQSICDYGSTCTPASILDDAPPNLASGTSASEQVDLYWAWIGSGVGAICLASGSADSHGCAGASPDADFDLGLPGDARVGSKTTTVINLTISSGP